MVLKTQAAGGQEGHKEISSASLTYTFTGCHRYTRSMQAATASCLTVGIESCRRVNSEAVEGVGESRRKLSSTIIKSRAGCVGEEGEGRGGRR